MTDNYIDTPRTPRFICGNCGVNIRVTRVVGDYPDGEYNVYSTCLYCGDSGLTLVDDGHDWGHDERALADDEEQVIATVTEWRRAHGLEPLDWHAIGVASDGQLDR
jgi:uncharacterized protein YkwD